MLIDADVHCAINCIDELIPYLPVVWQRYVKESGFKGPGASAYPKMKPYAARADAHPPSGKVPGGDLAFMQQQHFDHWKIDYAVMNPLYAVDVLPNIDFSAAMCAAANDFLIECWYEQDSRMIGSMIVPWGDADMAVREIERVGDHPSVRQIIFSVCTGALYGQRHFHPIWAAAEKHGLLIGIHWGGVQPATATGARPSFYLEHHVNLAQSAMAHVVSLVSEGVFQKYPALKVSIIECGIAWLPALMWRFDKDWRGCRLEVPWLDRPPSEIIRESFRFTTQPIEEPENPEHLKQTLEHIGSDDMPMFATDYPHWDFDAPDRALRPFRLGEALERRIFSENAATWYGIE